MPKLYKVVSASLTSTFDNKGNGGAPQVMINTCMKYIIMVCQNEIGVIVHGNGTNFKIQIKRGAPKVMVNTYCKPSFICERFIFATFARTMKSRI